MIRNAFLTSLGLLIVGGLGRVYANNYTYVDANGILRDTAWLPISTLLLLAGFALLFLSGVAHFIGYIKNRTAASRAS